MGACDWWVGEDVRLPSCARLPAWWKLSVCGEVLRAIEFVVPRPREVLVERATAFESPRADQSALPAGGSQSSADVVKRAAFTERVQCRAPRRGRHRPYFTVCGGPMNLSFVAEVAEAGEIVRLGGENGVGGQTRFCLRPCSVELSATICCVQGGGHWQCVAVEPLKWSSQWDWGTELYVTELESAVSAALVVFLVKAPLRSLCA